MYALFFSLTLIATVAGSTPFYKFAGGKISRSNDNNANGGKKMTIFYLPENTTPKSYDLRMVPNLEKEFNFSGVVRIDIFVRTSTNKILLHCKSLNVTEVTLTKNSRPTPATLKYELNPNNQLLIITTGVNLVDNTLYNLTVKFEGILNDDMVGFYRSSYKIGNETKWLATTQFEATDARMAFPCYDEPAHKTPFTIHIARYAHQKSISNMPLVNTSEPDPSINNRVWDTFRESPPMPTYLVAMLVSEMSFITDSKKNFVVWARENAIDDAAYIQKEGQRLLQQLEVFTGIPYALPKMDLAAVPDFEAGAMENWGLTLYRESALLYNPETGSEQSKNLVILTVAHELTHQWFGNYITPKWWDFIWLSEGFATYLSYVIVAQVEPSWRADECFLVDIAHNALWKDEVTSEHAMTSTLQSPKEIDDTFDFITYDKAGAVLRMLEHMVSTSTFNKALRKYLTKGNESGGVVAPNNLWDAFDEQIFDDNISLPQSVTIMTIMDQWTSNKGYPLIKVTRNGSDVKIEQETYKSTRSPHPTPDQKWIVPLTFTKQSSPKYANNTMPSKWSLPNKPIILKNEVNSDEWIIFNLQQTGYYRVNYDSENWELLIAQLLENPEEIHVLNRAQLLDDSFACAIDEKLPYTLPFTLATYLDNELDLIPWVPALQFFQRLYDLYEKTSVGPILKDYILERVKIPYNRLGFDVRDGEDHLTRITRPKILKLACSLGLPDCVAKAREEYVKNVKNLSKVQPDLKGVVYSMALNDADNMSVWENLWSLYRTSNVSYEKEEILMSLKYTKDEDLLRRFLEKLADPDVRRQDHMYIYQAISGSQESITVGLKFIKDQLSTINDLNRKSNKTLTKILQEINYKITTVEPMNLLDELSSEIKKLNDSKYDELLHELGLVRETSEFNIKYIQKSLGEIEIAIENSIRNATASTTPAPVTEHVPTTLKPSSAVSLLPSIASYLSMMILSCVIVNLS